MANIPNVRVNVAVRFPSLVIGSGPVTLTKENGVWRIGLDFKQLTDLMPVPGDYANSYFVYYSDVTKAFFTVSLTEMAIGLGIGQVAQIVTGAGAVAVDPTTTLVVINKAAPSATTINLPAVAQRGGLPLEVFDFGGNGGDITINPNAGDTIMGVGAWVVGSGGVPGSGGRARLIPSEDVGGWCV